MTHPEPAPRWRNPWPSVQAAWPEPPWIMAGSRVTAWFSVPWDALPAVMSPDLLPERTPTVDMRLRFYEVQFRGTAAVAPALGSDRGRFREAVFAFPARAGDVSGEVSLFMWTDDDTYLMWGREVFGWPLLRAELSMESASWSSADAEPRELARVVAAEGAAAVFFDHPLEQPPPSRRPAAWLTPRRVVRRGGLDADVREILVVRPRVISSGQRRWASGHVTMDFAAGHPLDGVQPSDVLVEIETHFEIEVGSDLDVIV